MPWQIYVDGASSGNPGDSGAGMVIFDENSAEIFRDSVFLGKMTNNMAEYEALLRALQKAHEYGAQDLVVYTDSLLVANQVIGTYKINNDILRQYVIQVKNITGNFDHFAIQYIPREQNGIADKLAKNGIKRGRRVVAP
jgi:ribonuclease HI